MIDAMEPMRYPVVSGSKQAHPVEQILRIYSRGACEGLRPFDPC